MEGRGGGGGGGGGEEEEEEKVRRLGHLETSSRALIYILYFHWTNVSLWVRNDAPVGRSRRRQIFP